MPRDHIIFDMDGVMINSEDVAMRVMDDWGVAFVRNFQSDADLPKDFIYTTYPGTSTNKIVEALIEKYDLSLAEISAAHGLDNVPPTLNDIGIALADMVTVDTIARFRAVLESIPGTTSALARIHQMFGPENVALATTSRADRMDISLAHALDPATRENAGLEKMFPKGAQRRSGYDYANKYDEAFAALGWKPAETIIVEDSLSGVTKAKTGRPEVAVIGTVAARFYTNKPAQAESLMEAGADIIISDMSDLPLAAQWIKDGQPAKRPDFVGEVFIPAARNAPPAQTTRPVLAK